MDFSECCDILSARNNGSTATECNHGEMTTMPETNDGEIRMNADELSRCPIIELLNIFTNLQGERVKVSICFILLYYC